MSQENTLTQMNDRSREVFQRIVESYLNSGEPVGSRTLSRSLTESVSAATIRNVMQDLEHLGLLDSPHVSAGRIPTQAGLRMFVDGLLEVDEVTNQDREKLDATLGSNDRDVGVMLDLSLIHISEPTRPRLISYAVFCLKKKNVRVPQ